MRFVAGKGAVAELLLAGAPWLSAIGKLLLAGDAIAELLLAGALWRSCCWPGHCNGALPECK